MLLVSLAIAGCALAALPVVLSLLNLPRFRRTPAASAPSSRDRLSVLIPARNEAARIGPTLDAVRGAEDPELEIVVMDDASEDGTPAVVMERARQDARVRLAEAPALPPGWNGKQHACHALAQVARGDILLFLDADVHLESDALPRIRQFLDQSDAALVSGFPQQQTETFLERLLLPLVHFVLLGFLPFSRMQGTTDPAFGAGCGQLMVARRDGYEQAGGHAAIRNSRHDGIMLPRAFRKAGLGTDLFDASDLATCRMYENGPDVWNGLAKNATEGMASPGAIVPWTLVLLGGQVLPLVLFALGLVNGFGALVMALAALGVLLSYAPRAVMATRIRQSVDSVLLHPLGVLLLVVIQWYALARKLGGRTTPWKGR